MCWIWTAGSARKCASKVLPLLPTVGLLRKSTVYGLNGRRAHFVMALSLVTYEHAIQKSRSFNALFSRTPHVPNMKLVKHLHHHTKFSSGTNTSDDNVVYVSQVPASGPLSGRSP